MSAQNSVLHREIFILQKKLLVNRSGNVGQQACPLVASHADRPSCHTRISNDFWYFDPTTTNRLTPTRSGLFGQSALRFPGWILLIRTQRSSNGVYGATRAFVLAFSVRNPIRAHPLCNLSLSAARTKANLQSQYCRHWFRVVRFV